MLETKKTIKITFASFNLIKGIMILMVVMTHVFEQIDFKANPIWYLSLKSLYRVGYSIMPAFWIISGYSFKEKDPKKLLPAAFSTLCKPAIYVTLISILLAPAVYFVLPYRDLKETVVDRLVAGLLGLAGPGKFVPALGQIVDTCGPLWFFWASFVAQNVLNLILRTTKNLWMQVAAVLLCLAAAYGLMEVDFRLFSIPQGLVAVLFVYTGYLLKKYKFFQRYLYNIWVYLLLIPISLLEIHFGLLSMVLGAFNNIVLDCIGSGAFAVLMLMAGLLLGEIECKFTDILKEVGVYSFWVLLIHYIEYSAIPWYHVSQYFTKYYDLYFFGMILARGIFITAGVIIVKKISKYNYARRTAKSGNKRIH